MLESEWHGYKNVGNLCHDLSTKEVDSAIAGFEPGSQPPKSAAEILLATLAQVNCYRITQLFE